MEVVLFEPEIPQNCGNVIRTCLATNSGLTLVRPLSFSLSDKYLKRSGLDYVKNFPIQCIDNLEAYLEQNQSDFYFFSSKAKRSYSEINFSPNSTLIFGSETGGLPDKYQERWGDRFYTIPMHSKVRCLNLANSVAIVLYKAWETNQFDFCNLKKQSQLIR